MPRPFYRIEACSPTKELDWFTVHGFQGDHKRQQVINTARSMREHMDAVFTIRVLQIENDAEEVIWKE